MFDEYTGENQSEQRAHEDRAEATGVETVLLAEFLRDPSGWGSSPDRRTLYQVVRDEEFGRPKRVIAAARRTLARRFAAADQQGAR